MDNFFKNGKDQTINIVAANLILMVVYTVLLRAGGKDNIISVALLLALHIICCVIISPFTYTKAFLLSALGLLLIGFSTCFLVYAVV